MKIIDYRTTKFVIIPKTLVIDQSVTYRDKCVYMALATYANNTTKAARPSTQTIADNVGCSRSSVFDSLKRLEQSGYIKRKSRSSKKAGSLTNIYYLLDK